MRYLKWFYRLVILLILLASFFIFLVTTNSGLYLTTKLASLILPGELVIENPEGKIINHFSFAKLHYKNKNIDLKLKNFAVKWRWSELLNRHLFVENLEAAEVKLLTRNTEKKRKKLILNFQNYPLF